MIYVVLCVITHNDVSFHTGKVQVPTSDAMRIYGYSTLRLVYLPGKATVHHMQ